MRYDVFVTLGGISVLQGPRRVSRDANCRELVISGLMASCYLNPEVSAYSPTMNCICVPANSMVSPCSKGTGRGPTA